MTRMVMIKQSYTMNVLKRTGVGRSCNIYFSLISIINFTEWSLCLSLWSAWRTSTTQSALWSLRPEENHTTGYSRRWIFIDRGCTNSRDSTSRERWVCIFHVFCNLFHSVCTWRAIKSMSKLAVLDNLEGTSWCKECPRYSLLCRTFMLSFVAVTLTVARSSYIQSSPIRFGLWHCFHHPMLFSIVPLYPRRYGPAPPRRSSQGPIEA